MSGISIIRPRSGKRTSLITGILMLGPWASSLSASDCTDPVAQAISVQGRVETRAEDQQNWTPLNQNDRLCPGDHLRVGAHSRAALSLNDDSLLRLPQHSTIRISAPKEDGSAWLDLLEGITHFISRVRHGLQINSPYVNASIEGTEFTVKSTKDEGNVTVLEGRVRAANEQGELLLEAGQRAVAGANESPRAEAVVDPLDAVQWALYYPPVVQPSADGASADLNASYKAYREGDLEQAFTALERVNGADTTAELQVYRAALLLRVGEVEAAQSDLDAALALSADNPDALALKSIIASVRSQRQQAIDLAQQALNAKPSSATALLALSYARQGNFQLSESLDAAEKATQAAPDNALAWSRLAELQLMFRRLDAATASAGRAASIAPDLAQVQTTLGFARLIRLDLKQAQAAFERAAGIDQAAPLPRLGLGLVLIRQGELAEGRRQIETAANLDPGNALIRSYLGKAYYEEKRDDRAATQFELAKNFDELDPTAWFYDAILKQSQNRPQEALEDLQTAIDLNDNRAVYRSRLLLDEDRAARSASLASIYDDLGFERLALKESWKSLADNPGNASAHRFLSDSYLELPRHEIARVSELMQYQMLNPEIVVPVSPSTSETNLQDFQGSGLSLAGYREYNPLFNRQRLSALASGVTGSNNTRGEEITVGGFTNRGMLSAGYYNASSDGFRENNASEQTIRNVFGQFRLNSELSIQGEVKHSDGVFGDMLLRFDPSIVFDDLSREADSDSYRVGLNYSPNPGNTFLLSSVSEDLEEKSSLFGNQIDSQIDGKLYEFQYIHKGAHLNLVAGVGRLETDTTTTLTLPFFGTLPPTEDNLEQKTAHLYGTLLHPWGETILGVDYISLQDTAFPSERRYNPKLGLLWQASDQTLVRLAAFKTLRSENVDNKTLMPTQVAGFNQIYDDFLGTKATRYGVGVDHRFNDQLNGGIELSKRDVDMLLTSPSIITENQRELSHTAFIYWHISNRFKLGGKYNYESFERDFTDGFSEPERPATLDTQSISVSGGWFHPSGLFIDVVASQVSQEIEEVLPTTGTASDSDNFLVTDLELGYRIAGRRGLLTLQAKNIFDESFSYQSVYPGTGTALTSPYTPERAFYMNLEIWLH